MFMKRAKSHLPRFYRFMSFMGRITYIAVAAVVIYMIAVIVCDKMIFGYSVLMRWRELLISFVSCLPWIFLLRYVIKARAMNRDQLNTFFAFYFLALIVVIVIMFNKYLATGVLKNAFVCPALLISMLIMSKYNQDMPNKGDENFPVE